MKRSILLITWLILASVSTFSQTLLRTQGQAIVDANDDTVLLRGMGLGGWMIQEGYMLQTASFANPQHQIRAKIEELIGPADTDEFYDAWLANHVRKIDIDSLKAWGFNSVRLPMHYNLFTLPIEDEPVPGQQTWLTKGFELTDSVISWCKQNGMYVVLDLHAAPGGQGQDQGISDYDPTKPSLWESQDNRDKTVALWKRLAERYVNEPVVAGYDLLNEPNWPLPGNVLLRELYEEITDSIRTVDNNHIIFIEGNWFANDFTGLTPPWDNNMVYSPHKYWSINDQASIQWVLDIRNTHNIPLYLGETGENSNTWFRDAVRLYEDFDMGWAWWPMKKVEAIAGPLSVTKNPGYQDLLDYWNGTGPQPTAAAAKNALLQLTENLKLENCVYQKDVIDALFRQVYDPTTIPYRTQSIPGVVFATDFDMGVAGSAYHDADLATYHVSTGNYTAWNQGWAYRNDGVDIEVTEETINTNGYNVGWIEPGEWMQYDVDVASSGVYDVNVRVAADGSDGKFHFTIGEADISEVTSVPNTGGWQTWQTLTISDVILDETDQKIRFYADAAGFNLSSFEFALKGATTTVPTDYLSAFTLDKKTVQLNLNKVIAGPLPASPADFQILVNGSSVPITQTVLNSTNGRIITFTVSNSFKSTDLIQISYSGNQIDANDGTSLSTFSLEEVQNRVSPINPVPGRVEAEDYFFQSGIQLETTTDVGGGQNVGFLDVGDYMDYYISVEKAGSYDVAYRTAAESEIGAIELQLIDSSGSVSVLQNVSFSPTGGWQTWQTTSKVVQLPQGVNQIRILITQPLFNINWFEFSATTSVDDLSTPLNINLFPNPSTGMVTLKGNLQQRQNVDIQVMNSMGQVLQTERLSTVTEIEKPIDLSAYSDGTYLVVIRLDDGRMHTQRVMKAGD
jgi:endoglucanase